LVHRGADQLPGAANALEVACRWHLAVLTQARACFSPVCQLVLLQTSLLLLKLHGSSWVTLVIDGTGYFDAGALARGNNGSMPHLPLLPQRIFAKKTARFEFHNLLAFWPTHNFGRTVNKDKHRFGGRAFLDHKIPLDVILPHHVGAQKMTHVGGSVAEKGDRA
jgi:hypothetical protein